MISLKHKFIFIHVPKTGGTSVSHAIGSYSEDKIAFTDCPGNLLSDNGHQGIVANNPMFKHVSHVNYYVHASVEDLYQVLGNDIFSFYLFAVVRNPYDRVISHTSFVNGINSIPLRLQNFSMPKPQLDYLKLGNEIIVKNIIRFENLQSDFNNVCRDLGLRKTTLLHKKKSKEAGHRRYYTTSTKEMISRMYQEEIEYFGYEF